tara:strand:- start:2976 stop:3194 length:219 start_codon:yes stop_codon:yes gene_type:complete
MIEETPEQILRNTRNMMLVSSDWQMMKANETNVGIDNWKTYRQALRDLPANSTPSLDKDGNLIGVTWPTKPE